MMIDLQRNVPSPYCRAVSCIGLCSYGLCSYGLHGYGLCSYGHLHRSLRYYSTNTVRNAWGQESVLQRPAASRADSLVSYACRWLDGLLRCGCMRVEGQRPQELRVSVNAAAHSWVKTVESQRTLLQNAEVGTRWHSVFGGTLYSDGI